MGMTPTQAKQLGELIAAARLVKGVSLRVLARELDVSLSWLSELEAGKYRDLPSDRLARLADALDIEPARIDAIALGTVADGLPEVRMYFRAKYGLTSEQAERVARYANRVMTARDQDAA